MDLEQTTFDYRQIVPEPRQPSFAERHLPTLLGLARKLGYLQAPAEPEVEQHDYPARMSINLPEVPHDNGGHQHPLLYFFERAGELADRLTFTGGQRRELRFKMDRSSWERVINVPFHGDGTLGGDTMYHAMALNDYASEWFEEHGYALMGAGVGSNTFELTLERA